MSTPPSRLAGRAALITGSSSGAGAEIAREYARLGAHVAIHCGSDMAAARRVVDDIRQHGNVATAFQADLRDAAATRRLAREVTEQLGPVSVLVNNAGPFSDTPFLQLKEADWDAVLAVNLKAPFVLVQELAPAMIRQGWGRIVNLAATSAMVRSALHLRAGKGGAPPPDRVPGARARPQRNRQCNRPQPIASARTDTMPVYKAAAIAETPLQRLVTEKDIAKIAARLCEAEF